MAIKAARNFLMLSVCVALLTGCAGAIYRQNSWSPPRDTDKATSDWDVASAICDARAGDRELTPEEKLEIAEKKQELQETGSAVQELMDDVGIEGGELAGAVAGFLSGFLGGKKDKEDEEFVKCMEEFGWKK